MAKTQAIRDSRGFTTDHFKRCCICQRETDGDHYRCECGALIVRVRLQPKQQQMLDWVMATGPDVPTKLAFGGSRAAGKSRMLRDVSLIVASEIAQRHSGIPVFIMRRNWTQCKENHLAKFQLERPMLQDYYGDKQYEFPDGMGASRIVFTYADTPEDVERLERGPECFLMCCDQAEQVREMDLQKLNSCNRWPDAEIGAAKTIYAYNPGGAGTPYLKRVFYDRDFKENETPGDFVFLQAYGWDNVSWALNQGIDIDGHPLTWERYYDLPGDLPECANGKYNKAWLDSIPDNHRFKIFVTKTSEGRKHWAKPESIRMGDLFGRFDQFEGQYFSGIWDSKRVVLR